MNSSRSINLQECFQILNVPENADWEHVRRSFIRLAKQYHPDRNSPDRTSEGQFKALSYAFEILNKHYREKSQVSAEIPTIQTDAWRGGEGTGNSQALQALPSKIPSADPRKSWARLKRNSWAFLCRLERKLFSLDVPARVEIDRETAKQGGTVKVDVAGERFYVLLPEDLGDATEVKIPGRGESGFLKRNRGDLLLHVRIMKKPISSAPRKIYYRVKVSSADLRTRRNFTLQSPEGPISYFLPPSIQTGHTVRLKAPKTSFMNPENNYIVIIDLV